MTARRACRVLLTEGGSTSAREAVTALALAGHEVSYCDPAPFCLGRFSRLVARRYRCPPLGTQPQAYRVFVRALLATGRFDVLLPIHEQGYLFAFLADEVAPHARLALPRFDSYARLQVKSGLKALLGELGLAHPETETVRDRAALAADDAYPYVLKADIGTASRGTWPVRGRAERDRALAEIASGIPSDVSILRQEWVSAPLEQAQAVFQEGRLVGFHATRRLIEGAGGGAALKESVDRPRVASDLARIGRHLAWHGALSVDYFHEGEGRALYIDGNPRLVEPMAAALAGVDLADLLIRVSLGERLDGCATGRPGVRTRLALQALLGAALRERSRRAVLATCRDLLGRGGAFAGAREELSPTRLDPPSAVPVIAVATALLARPAQAAVLARRGWGDHLLTAEAARAIRAMR